MPTSCERYTTRRPRPRAATSSCAPSPTPPRRLLLLRPQEGPRKSAENTGSASRPPRPPAPRTPPPHREPRCRRFYIASSVSCSHRFHVNHVSKGRWVPACNLFVDPAACTCVFQCINVPLGDTHVYTGLGLWEVARTLRTRGGSSGPFRGSRGLLPDCTRCRGILLIGENLSCKCVRLPWPLLVALGFVCILCVWTSCC